jgi:hypothetical protein
MGTCRLGLAIIVALSLFVAKPEPARAGGAAALAALHADASAELALALPVLWHHSRRVQSYYLSAELLVVLPAPTPRAKTGTRFTCRISIIRAIRTAVGPLH